MAGGAKDGKPGAPGQDGKAMEQALSKRGALTPTIGATASPARSRGNKGGQPRAARRAAGQQGQQGQGSQQGQGGQQAKAASRAKAGNKPVSGAAPAAPTAGSLIRPAPAGGQYGGQNGGGYGGNRWNGGPGGPDGPWVGGYSGGYDPRNYPNGTVRPGGFSETPIAIRYKACGSSNSRPRPTPPC